MDPIGRLLLLAIECRLGPGFRLNLGLMIGSTEPIWATARRIPGLPVFRLCAMCLCITDRLCCGFLSRSGSGFALVGCGCLLYLLAEVFGGSLGLLAIFSVSLPSSSMAERASLRGSSMFFSSWEIESLTEEEAFSISFLMSLNSSRSISR